MKGLKMKTITGFACALLAIGCLTINAQEVLNVPKWAEEFKEIAEKGSPKDVNWEKAAKLGSKGNVYVFFDKKGNPEIYVIGKAPISSALIASDAEEDADEEAEFNAKAAFALWMSEHFAVKNTREKKVLTVRRGNKNADGNVTRSEQAEAVTISKRLAEQTANAQWRGMRKFAAKRTEKDFIVVWRWSLTEHKFARLIEMLTRDGNVGDKDRKIETFDWTFR